MAIFTKLVCIHVLCIFICLLVRIDGKTCHRIVERYRYETKCTRRGWWWRCTRYETIAHPYYITVSYCCPGYTGYQCRTPICNPPCKNGGVCISPNQCRCEPAFTGNDCQQVVCSHQKPCFPGTCTFPDRCECQDGFKGQAYCLNLERKEKPIITKASSSLIFIERKTKQYQYRFDADSTSPNISTVDRQWINERDFNYINIQMEAIYSTPTLQVPPKYISDYDFGITGGKAEVILTKIPRDGGPPYVSKHDNYRCPVNVPDRQPEKNVYKCNITDENFDRILEHGDNMTVTVKADNGGFRDLYYVSTTNFYRTELYHGQTQHKTMVYHFDFFKPKHCSESGSCTDYAFKLEKDITKDPIIFQWGGWRDELAGVMEYTWEVFKLTPDIYRNFLTEPNPMRPLKHIKLNTSTVHYTYTPPQPGTYSFLLEVKDNANNSQYVRRLAIYDPVSTISVIKSQNTELYIESAEKETAYKWQSTLQNEQFNGTPIRVRWLGHFVNKVHEEQKLLYPVKPFPRQDFNTTTGSVRTFKAVGSGFEDSEGKRSLQPISNIHGIIKFYINYKKDHSGGSMSTTPPNTGWIEVANINEEYLSLNISRQDGDSLRVWVRAEDVMGNIKIDSTEVSFDSSPPILQRTRLYRNVNSTYPFSSSISLTSQDNKSGVFKVKYVIKDIGNGTVFKEGEVFLEKALSCSDITKCYTIPLGEHFYYKNNFPINNCWMVVPKAQLDSQVLVIEITVYNMAMLSNSTVIKVDNLKSFAGMEDYSGPMNVRVTKVQANGVRLEWEQSPSCYDRQEIQIHLGNGIVITVHKDATLYDIVGLDPEKNYTISLYTAYGSHMQLSNPVKISFLTAPDPGLSGGAIAAIVIVMLILVSVIVVGVVMWRTGRLNTAQQKIRRRLTKYSASRRRNNLRNAEHLVKFDNLSYAGQADDIYLYGGMTFEDKQNWQIPHSEIVLEDKICSGRFADIFKAKRETRRNDKSIVVAKIMKEQHKEQDEFIMQAKINFLATKVGDHPNILQFIGAVVGNPGLGPFIVTELCEEGTLKQWLDKTKTSATDDVVERLYRIVFEVSKGMEYLATQNIVHRRLAARNIMLTENLEAKVAGFGPTLDLDCDENELNNKCGSGQMFFFGSVLFTCKKQTIYTILSIYSYPMEHISAAPYPGLITPLGLFCPQSGQCSHGPIYTFQKAERIPVKWMAPECMTSTQDANEASDVWSYAVVMWEVFSFGDTPYDGIKSRDVKDKVKGGYRMGRPEYCGDEHYNIMTRCWDRKPKKRPTFTKIVEELSNTFCGTPSDEFYYYSEKQ